MRVKKSGLLWLMVVFIFGGGLLGLADQARRDVLFPLLAVAILATATVVIVRSRSNGCLSAFEVGVVYTSIVTVYAAFPLVAYLANGLSYTPTSDSRLYAAQPGAEAVGFVGWYYVIYLASFAGAYLVIRGRGEGAIRAPAIPSISMLVAAVVGYVTIQLFFVALRVFFDFSADRYAESYLAFTRLPLWVAQAANHLGGARLVLSLVILAALMARFSKTWFLVVAWFALLAGLTFVRMGSRTDLALLMLAAATLYHHVVRRVSLRKAFIAGLVALLALTYFGVLRSMEGNLTLEDRLSPFSHSSEFETLFANAFDVTQRKQGGEIPNLPRAFWLADLYSLVPQQLLRVEKVSPSTFYVSYFYPEFALTGGGLAFGVITEGIVGRGWLDLVIRGAVLGIMLALIHRHYLRKGSTLFGFLAYVWVSVLSYQLFRHTTFSLLAPFVYQFIPAILATRILSAAIRAPLLRGLPFSVPGRSLDSPT